MIAVNFNLYICLDTCLGKIITFLKNEAKTIEERSLKCSLWFFFLSLKFTRIWILELASKKCGKKASTPADAQIWLTKMSQMSNVSGNFWWFIVEFHKKANKNISNAFFKINAKWQKCYFFINHKNKNINTDFKCFIIFRWYSNYNWENWFVRHFLKSYSTCCFKTYSPRAVL